MWRTLLRNRWARFARDALLVVAAWALIGAYQTRRHVSDHAPAPDFTLVDLDGKAVSLHDFRHRKVVLHFFATWCGVCKAELPSLRGLFGNLGDDETLLAIVQDADDLEAVRRFVREHEIEYPVLLGNRAVLSAYGVNAFPTNYYVNGDGTVSASTTGLSTRVGMGLHLLATSR